MTDFEKEPAETGKDKLTDWQVRFLQIPHLTLMPDSRIGWLYYVSVDQNFQGCTRLPGWELIDVTAQQGQMVQTVQTALMVKTEPTVRTVLTVKMVKTVQMVRMVKTEPTE